jgi:hypothetical protein
MARRDLDAAARRLVEAIAPQIVAKVKGAR